MSDNDNDAATRKPSAAKAAPRSPAAKKATPSATHRPVKKPQPRTAVEDKEPQPSEDASETGAPTVKYIDPRTWPKEAKIGVAVVAILVIIAVVALGRGGSHDSGDGGGSSPDQFRITYRHQLTQEGGQAGCFVLMQGDRAIGISCLPADQLQNSTVTTTTPGG